MSLPPGLKQKYVDRFDELIVEGEYIAQEIREFLENKATITTGPKLMQWKTNCISLLSQVLQGNKVHEQLLEEFDSLEVGCSGKVKKAYLDQLTVSEGVGKLKAIRDDFEKEFLSDLSLQIEAELAADYMGQAEQLLAEGQTGQYDHVPAAVLAGAVLEKGLRTLCSKQIPPLPLVDGKGNPLMLNRLIDDLKKAGAFTELKAKQLRAWADIRNKAAHGEFSEFSHNDVETMIGGINNFLADYLS